MSPEEIRNRIPESEFIVTTSRSSGPGANPLPHQENPKPND